jgi:hypothetical protein
MMPMFSDNAKYAKKLGNQKDYINNAVHFQIF